MSAKETVKSKDSELSHVADGVLFPWTVPKSTLEQLKHFDVYKDDVWIITYPKAGTHWTTEIAGNIFAGGEGEVDNRFRAAPLEMTIPGKLPSSLEGAVRNHQNVAKMRTPRIINTHLPLSFLPRKLETVKPKILYVARNPKDTCVSFHNFLKKTRSLYTCDINYDTLGDFIEAFCDGSCLMGSWWKHTVEFWDKRQEDNIMFIKYEELKKKPSDSINRIANFLERPLSKKGLENILSATSFNAMKKSESFKKKGPILLRKGDIGDWKNNFTVLQNEIFDEIYEEKMKHTDLRFEFE